MNTRNKIAMLEIISMGFIAENYGSNAKPIEIQPRPPKGANEYFFNQCGEFSTEMPKHDTVFICYAINDNNAQRKYNKWLNKQ